MNDYTWPSIYFAYFFFAISLGARDVFLRASWKDGYWGKGGEESSTRVFEGRTPPDGNRDEPASKRR